MGYTLVIGTRNWSSWSLRAWLAMRATGAPFAEVLIALRRPGSAALIEQYSPSARIPVLRVAEGAAETVVFDSLAICETLAERHPEAALWPHDEAARALARSYAAEMHSGFLALREALSMDFARTLPPRRPLDAGVQHRSRAFRRRGARPWSASARARASSSAGSRSPIACMRPSCRASSPTA